MIDCKVICEKIATLTALNMRKNALQEKLHHEKLQPELFLALAQSFTDQIILFFVWAGKEEEREVTFSHRFDITKCPRVSTKSMYKDMWPRGLTSSL